MKALLLMVTGLAVSMIFTGCGSLDGSGGGDPLDGARDSPVVPMTGTRGYDGARPVGDF